MHALAKKHWPWAALAVVLAAVLPLVANHLSSAGDTPAADSSAVAKGTMGTPVTRNGIFEYTVTSLNCNTATVDGAEPKDRFCVVSIVVHNLSGTARKPGIAFAKAYDTAGTGYLTDAVAQIRAERRGSSLLDELAPDARITTGLIYDVPRHTTITSVLLLEEPSSPGIQIPLS
jgi:hypothetical protein